MIDRRIFLAGMAALAACSDTTFQLADDIHRKRMAITMDDFNLGFVIGLNQQARHENILEAFNAVGHKAAGFVTGSFIDSKWGHRVLRDWLSGDHLIANHTWTHMHANESETDVYLSEIEKTRDFLLSFPATSNFFRYPFLDDGRDRDQQVALYQGVSDLELLNAPVTMDSIDWYTASRLEAALKSNPNTDLAPYRDYYVEMCVTLSNYWDGVAQALGFKSLPHLTLVHHNVLNGYFLEDVLVALKADGWRFVDAEDALQFKPFHAVPPEPTHGRNWLTLQARQMEISVPPFPEKYLGFGRKTMDALGL